MGGLFIDDAMLERASRPARFGRRAVALLLLLAAGCAQSHGPDGSPADAAGPAAQPGEAEAGSEADAAIDGETDAAWAETGHTGTETGETGTEATETAPEPPETADAEPPALPPRWIALAAAEGLFALRFDDVAEPVQFQLAPRLEDFTETQNWSYDLRWSPNGAHLAFLTHAPDYARVHLFVASAVDGFEPREVALPLGFYAEHYWIGAETLLVRVRIDEQDSELRHFEFYRVPVADPADAELIARSDNAGHISPPHGAVVDTDDHTLIVSGAEPVPTLDLGTLRFGCSMSYPTLDTSCVDDMCNFPRWSPDGQWLAMCVLTGIDAPEPPDAGQMVQIGRIPLPAVPAFLAPVSELVYEDQAFNGTPTDLEWAPNGTIVAHRMRNYPVTPPEQDPTCTPQGLVVADVATGEIYSNVDFGCEASCSLGRCHRFLAPETVLLGRHGPTRDGFSTELVLVRAGDDPVVAAIYDDEHFGGLDVTADGDVIYVLTCGDNGMVLRSGAVAEFVETGSLATLFEGDIDRGSLSLAPRGGALLFVAEQRPCVSPCTNTHVVNGPGGDSVLVSPAPPDFEWTPRAEGLLTHTVDGVDWHTGDKFQNVHRISSTSAWDLYVPSRWPD